MASTKIAFLDFYFSFTFFYYATRINTTKNSIKNASSGNTTVNKMFSLKKESN